MVIIGAGWWSGAVQEAIAPERSATGWASSQT